MKHSTFVLRTDPWKDPFFHRQVPNTNRPLPFLCPKCQHDGCMLIVKSLTVMTWTCDHCGHTWATEMEHLPPEIQARVPDALKRQQNR